ncbi:glycosyltransferase [Candidatus Clostridium radicumherbarum]|uniref:Glycosyltransferase n=1 Tax=Candidatus Clostridium radicumherbarum TaxID=3381662 RepID=A0ABW8TTJ7_9CLOT
MSKKVLIVYEKMGMGHFRMASILEDMLKGEDVEIIIRCGSEMINDNSLNFVVKFWNYCIKNNFIRTVDFLLNFFVRIFILPFMEITSTEPYYKKLEEINPDIVICTADGFNRAIGTYAKEKNIPFYIFITEVSIFIDLVNPYATHLCYFNETGDAIRSYDFNNTYYSYELTPSATIMDKIKYVLKYYKDFVVFGYKNSIFRNPNRDLAQLNNAKYEVIGPLAEKKHFRIKNQEEIIKIKEEFGLNNGKEIVVLASGSIGGKFLIEILKVIIKSSSKPMNLVVICGKDEVTYQELVNYSYNNENIKLVPLKFINNFDELLSAADCIIGRPSAGIFIESLVNRTPEITFRTATSNDLGTLTMIEKYELGRVVENKKEIVEALEDILNNKENYLTNMEMLLNSYCKTYDDKKELLKEIILNQRTFNYEVSEDYDADLGLNTPLSH